MSRIKIPQIEPWFDDKEKKAVSDYMKSGGWVMEYKKTLELERMIADFTGARYSVMTVNGTVSLILALLALDIGAQDEVIVPDLSMIATPNSCVFLGVRPVLVDIESETLCLDLEKAESAITKKTKAFIYVPVNGRSGNMNEAVRFAKKHSLYLIEDAAQALGSYWKGKHLGTFGVIGTLSFSAPKIISTGQGGALLTNKKNIYKKVKRLKNFGRETGGHDVHDHWGWNFKFTDIQAVIGIEQMKKLSFRVKRKKEIYKRYLDGLSEVKDVEFISTDLNSTSPWFIDIYVGSPNKLSEYLKKYGIGTRRIYQAIHTQKIYGKDYSKDAFPVATRYSRRGLWLPSSSKLKNSEVDFVTKVIREYYRK